MCSPPRINDIASFQNVLKFLFDGNELQNRIISAANDSSPLDTSLVLEKAFDLKKRRYSFALQFVVELHAESLCSEIEEKMRTEKQPVRSWINGVLENLLVSLQTTRFIDILRIISCTPENINNYFDIAIEIISRFNKYLIFGADETMLFPSVKRKVVLPANIANEFITAQPQLPHFLRCAHTICSENIWRTLLFFLI